MVREGQAKPRPDVVTSRNRPRYDINLQCDSFQRAHTGFGYSKPMTLRNRLFLAALWSAALLLGGCGSELDTRGEVLRVLETTLEPAYLGEEYAATIRVVGGLTPYTVELSKGTLPPGLTLQGATLRGVPTTEGNYTFTVSVSDANLSKTFQDYTLNVQQPPPAELTLNVPLTDVQRPVVLRGEVRNARDLQAFRTRVTWDPRYFALVPDTVTAANENFALFYEAGEGELELDLAVLGGSVSGTRRMFTFTLRPVVVTTLALSSETEFLGETGFAYQTLTEGTASLLDLEDVPGDETGGAGFGNDTGGGPSDDDDDDDVDNEGDDQ